MTTSFSKETGSQYNYFLILLTDLNVKMNVHLFHIMSLMRHCIIINKKERKLILITIGSFF